VIFLEELSFKNVWTPSDSYAMNFLKAEDNVVKKKSWITLLEGNPKPRSHSSDSSIKPY